MCLSLGPLGHTKGQYGYLVKVFSLLTTLVSLSSPWMLSSIDQPEQSRGPSGPDRTSRRKTVPCKEHLAQKYSMKAKYIVTVCCQKISQSSKDKSQAWSWALNEKAKKAANSSTFRSFYWQKCDWTFFFRPPESYVSQKKQQFVKKTERGNDELCRVSSHGNHSLTEKDRSSSNNSALQFNMFINCLLLTFPLFLKWKSLQWSGFSCIWKTLINVSFNSYKFEVHGRIWMTETLLQKSALRVLQFKIKLLLFLWLLQYSTTAAFCPTCNDSCQLCYAEWNTYFVSLIAYIVHF